MSDRDRLWAALERARRRPRRCAWLRGVGRGDARPTPPRCGTRFPMAGRKVGRAPLRPGRERRRRPRLDDRRRGAHAAARRARRPASRTSSADLYRFGDAAERRGLLRALPYLPVGDARDGLVDDAIRTNDTRLVAAALGPYATEHLDDAAYDQAVLKCVFIGVPIAPLDGLPARATAETARMLAAFVHERVAAGRDIPAEVWDVIDRHPPAAELAAIEAERASEFADRREAAERALAHHRPGGVS